MIEQPQLILPTHLGQALLDYLATKPYREVYQLVAALQQLQPVPTPEETES
jgi:hypothetical protein